MVEDHENDFLLLKLALERVGIRHPIYSVPGGLEAVAYLRGDPPYQDRNRYPLPFLLFLDVRIPRFDGFEVLRWIRSQPEFERIPVVMMSGSNHVGDIDTAYQLGASSFLVKSVDFGNGSELSRMVDRFLSPEWIPVR